MNDKSTLGEKRPCLGIIPPFFKEKHLEAVLRQHRRIKDARVLKISTGKDKWYTVVYLVVNSFVKGYQTANNVPVDRSGVRRLSTRIPFHCICKVEADELVPGGVFETEMCDLSGSGACINDIPCPLIPGDKIKLCFPLSSEKTEFEVDAIVRNKHSGRLGLEFTSTPEVLAKMALPLCVETRRSEKRYALEQVCQVSSADGMSHPVVAVNISAGGLGLENVPETWSSGQELTVCFSFPTEDLVLPGKVVWQQDTKAGLHFLTKCREMEKILFHNLDNFRVDADNLLIEEVKDYLRTKLPGVSIPENFYITDSFTGQGNHSPGSYSLKAAQYFFNPVSEVRDTALIRKEFWVRPEVNRDIKSFCGREGVRVFHVCLAALYIYFQRLTGQDGVCVARTAFSARTGWVPCRFPQEESRPLSFRNLLSELQRQELTPPALPGVESCETGYLAGVVENDLGVDLTLRQRDDHGVEEVCPVVIYPACGDERDNIRFMLDYKGDLFLERDIELMFEHYLNILIDAIKKPGQDVFALEMLDLAEQNTILSVFNDTRRDYPADKTVAQLFEEQVDKTPERIAVVFGAKRLTYKELDEKANRIARFLISELDVKPDNFVGILLDKSIEMMIAIIGILKAGAAYLPLDPKFPENRLKGMIEDTETRLILSSKKYIKMLNTFQWECACFDYYLCLDSDDVLQEEEQQENALMDKNLWLYVGDTATDSISGGGWQNSYTGEDFSAEEMEEYSANILKKIKPLCNKNTRILEIGCGSGLSMFKLAPFTALYYGTDLSDVIIEKNRNRAAKEGFSNIGLKAMAAHEIDSIEEKEFDIIIMNSVVQCFHGHNYLRKVLAKAVTLLKNEGTIFIGDIMDQDLKEELLDSLLEFENKHTSSGYTTKTDFSYELFISRDFMRDLKADIPSLRDVAFSDKIYTIENELTRFRYDAFLYIDKNNTVKTGREKKRKKQLDRSELFQYGTDRIATDAGANNLIYIMYTSGSTGKPKGVMVENRNVVRLVKNTNYVDFSCGRGILQTGALVFDASTFEYWGALLNGLSLYLVEEDVILDDSRLADFLQGNPVDYLWLTSSLFNQLCARNPAMFKSLKYLLVGGDVLNPRRISEVREYCKNLNVINGYGPTENTTFSTTFHITDDYQGDIPIGKPIANSTAYVLDKYRNIVPVGCIGELYVGGDGVSRGYLKAEELTEKKFIKHINRDWWSANGAGKLYRTGDLARWLPDGNLEFFGRKDHQVKIRGFRIELREIENKLLSHPGVKEIVVLVREDKGNDKYLCAYYVGKDGALAVNELRGHIRRELPEYMIPQYFVHLEKMPLNGNGKVDRKALPEPDLDGLRGSSAVALDGDLEKELARLWSEVLGVNHIGAEDDFFALGGHSLKATALKTKIEKQFSITLPFRKMFENTTIRKMRIYLESARKTVAMTIEPAARRSYYPLSSAQKRMFIAEQLDRDSQSYNEIIKLDIEGELDKKKLEAALVSLLERHESLRTGFIIMADQIYQKIFESGVIQPDIRYYDDEKQELADVIAELRKPYDLSSPPFFRVAVLKISDKLHKFILGTHHIIMDGVSEALFIKELVKLYSGEILPDLKIQYKDYAVWQNRQASSPRLKKQEEYWIEKLSGDVPALNFPTDFPRPEVQSFEGDVYSFKLQRELTLRLKSLAARRNATLYMVLLTVFNILLHKYTGQDDLKLGTGVANRNHDDLYNIIGMFLNMLVIRTFPSESKTFRAFLEEVCRETLDIFENQDFQFDALVDKLPGQRDISRNPLFDVVFILQNYNLPGIKAGGIEFKRYEYYRERAISKFDIMMEGYEQDDEIHFNIEYCTKLFRPETIKRFAGHFLNIIRQILAAPEIQLGDIDLLLPSEKKRILDEFNRTELVFPAGKTVVRLFEEQTLRNPDHPALISSNETLTYRELDERSNRLADFLLHNYSQKKEMFFGIYMPETPEMFVAILGVLKAGGAYIPVDPALPEIRVRDILEDSGVEFVITSKSQLKTVNKLQWELDTFRYFLCLDSDDVHAEEETEENKLMDTELWRYVGKTATDMISGGGWKSSYTGQDLTKAEMNEYADNIVAKLNPYCHKDTRVLEIGCASGISMFKIAPRVGRYYGTDLSEEIIKKTRRIVETLNYSHVSLECLAAHEVDKIQERNFDVIIINSVIQCFHGHNYLRKVIKKAIGLLKPKGILFIGDIMDQDLKAELTDSLQQFKNENNNPEYKTKTDLSAELFIARDFFKDLRYDINEIADIEFSTKIHTIKNELTQFRYDALLRIDKNLKDEFLSPKKTRKKYQFGRDVLNNCSPLGFPPRALPDNLAYVIYTSGSTGKPKGVLVEHRSLVNLCWWHNTHYAVTEYDRATKYAGLGFDASVWEIFPYLVAGATLYLVDKEIKLDPVQLNNFFEKNEITIGFLPTQMCEEFMKQDNHSLRILLTGGDKLTRFRNCNYKLVNNYGPTENTVVSTSYTVSEYQDNIPIGKPVANNSVYILGKSGSLQSVGIPGELCLSGESLARGYLNRPELTAEKFVPNPFKPGTRMYRTGDLAKWLPDGNIEFLGRIDNQVKIRGFRIELGEIEKKLEKHQEIRKALVSDFVKEGNERYLCAYIVSDTDIPVADIKAFLAAELPEYMVPAFFMRIESIPLTPNGKIDRKALPEPFYSGEDSATDFCAPENEVEERLTEIWKEVLAVEQVGVTSDFFELGGHSLKITVLAEKVQREFGVYIPLLKIFKTPTIRAMAEYISAQNQDHSKDRDSNLVLLSTAKQPESRNLFLVHAGSGEVGGYLEFAQMLSSDFNVWGIKADSMEGYAPGNVKLEELAAKYLDKVKTVQSRGPYYLGGWCIGGAIAFEMIHQLEKKNENVAFFSMLNTDYCQPGLSDQYDSFTLEAETAFIKTIIPDDSFSGDLKDVTGTEELWARAVTYLSAAGNGRELLRKNLPSDMVAAIPRFSELGIAGIVTYANVCRTFNKARASYNPLARKLTTPIHFFEPESIKAQDFHKWSDCTSGAVNFYEVSGDHFSMFSGPDLEDMAEKFRKIFKGINRNQLFLFEEVI